MRETKFIEQNEEKWAEFEEMLRDNRHEPERLNDLFVQITDDLSYARTFYPNRSVRLYLNSLAQQVFHNVYKGRRFPWSRLRTFWTEEVPQVMWECRKALWLSFAIFAISVAIGVVSSQINPDFARVILGDSYVDMTIQNIQNGDPMAVYKDREAFGMTMGIAFNNIWVALLTALLGVLAGIGTIFMLIQNGVMLGAFQYFFIERGLFWDSFLTIWIHGTLEICAIIIAGAAGLTAGSGLVFPGTYRRGQAFQLSMRRGMKIFIGLIPIFALAAFFEGYFTRFTETPDAIRAFFIFVSAAFVGWYFVLLPYLQAKRNPENRLRDKDLPPDNLQSIDFTRIKAAGTIFSDMFDLVKKNFKHFFSASVLMAVAFCFFAFYMSENPIFETFNFNPRYVMPFGGTMSGAGDFLGKSGLWSLAGFQFLALAFLSILAFKKMENELPENQQVTQSKWRFLLFTVVLSLPLFALGFMFKMPYNVPNWLAMIIFTPFCTLWAFVIYRENANPFSALFRTFRLIRWEHALWTGFLITNLGLLMQVCLDAPIFEILFQFLGMNVMQSGDNTKNFMAILTILFSAGFLYFSYLMAAVCGGLLYFSFREIADATTIREAIPNIGMQRKIRGMPRE